MVRNSAILRTGVDQLMEYVHKKEKVSLEEVAKQLKMPLKTVQSLVDFLVEEKILGIEYKFTTPYVYLSKKDIREASFVKKKESPVLLSKEEFFEKAKSRNIPYQRIGLLWKKYLEEQLKGLKEDFYETAMKKRNLPREKVDVLWERYLSFM